MNQLKLYGCAIGRKSAIRGLQNIGPGKSSVQRRK